MKKILSVFLLIISFQINVYAQPFPPETDLSALDGIYELPLLKKTDRVLILAPHPDDEAIGCAGLIRSAIRAGADIHILYLTNGDNNQLAFMIYEKRLTFRAGEFLHMGEVRRQEAVKAMKLLGLNENNLTFLGYPDFGTFSIFRDYWGTDIKPFRSMLTRVSKVPYKEDLSFGAPYVGENVLKDLEYVLKKYRPNKIFVSHPADSNLDHRTLYLFLRVALADLEKEGFLPQIYTYLIHYKGWPLPRHYHPELALLPPGEYSNPRIRWYKLGLSPGEVEEKYKAILCYKSQTESSAFYLLSFARRNELYSTFPDVNADLTAEDLKLRRDKQSFLKKRIRLPLGNLSGFNKDNNACHINYAVQGDYFSIRIDKEQNMNNRLGGIIYIFGYNYNVPFGKMPKVRINTRYLRIKMFNGRKLIDPQGVKLTLDAAEMQLGIPLVLLGNPDFVLVSVKGYTEFPCLDSITFRKVNIRRLLD